MTASEGLLMDGIAARVLEHPTAGSCTPLIPSHSSLPLSSISLPVPAEALVELQAVTWGLRGLFGVRGKAVLREQLGSQSLLGLGRLTGGPWRLLLPSGSVP